MSLSALVLLSEGAEDMEAVIAIDVLRRGGITVTAASLHGEGPVKCSNGVVLHPDSSLESALTKGPYHVVVLPGGMKGAENLANSAVVGKLLKEQQSSGRVIAAICAAPAVSIVSHGIGEGKSITCYPCLKDKIPSDKYKYIDKEVVVDGNLITSQGPGTAFAFGLAIVEKLMGEDKTRETAKAMLL